MTVHNFGKVRLCSQVVITAIRLWSSYAVGPCYQAVIRLQWHCDQAAIRLQWGYVIRVWDQGMWSEYVIRVCDWAVTRVSQVCHWGVIRVWSGYVIILDQAMWWGYVVRLGSHERDNKKYKLSWLWSSYYHAMIMLRSKTESGYKNMNNYPKKSGKWGTKAISWEYVANWLISQVLSLSGKEDTDGYLGFSRRFGLENFVEYRIWVKQGMKQKGERFSVSLSRCLENTTGRYLQLWTNSIYEGYGIA